jgi:restriction system protein
MARRREESTISFLIRKPWYYSVIFSGLLYVILKYVVPLVPVGDPNEPFSLALISRNILDDISKLAPLAWIFLLAIPFSLFHSFRKKRNLNKQISVDSIQKLTWQEFEWLVSEAYRRKGWQAQESLDYGADGGVDVVLRKGKERWLVQCKQWRTSKVGVPKVRELFGAVAAEKATGGIFVTSGKYTKDALEFAKGKKLTLVDGSQLMSLIKGVQKKSFVKSVEETVDAVVARVQETRQSTSTTNVAPSPDPFPSTPEVLPACPRCGAPMVLRTAKKGANAGRQFYGCSTFPKCRGTIQTGE